MSNPTEEINDLLHQRNILVRLHITAVGNVRKDDEASAIVEEKYGSDSSMGQYVKHLFNPKSLKHINSLRSKASQTMQQVGIPWGYGWYVINVRQFEEFRKIVTRLTKEWNKAVKTWLDNYDSHVQEAKKRLGTMFNPEQYPTRDKVASLFEMRPEYQPILRGNDITRLVLGKEDTDKLEEIKENIEKRERELVTKGMKFVYGRIANALERIINRINESTRINSNNTMLETIQGIVNNLPNYNIANDDNLTNLHDEMMKSPLMTMSINELKEDECKRTLAKNEAKRFLQLVRQFC